MASTFSLYFGSLAGHDLYALSVFPDREVVDDVDVPADRIEAFILDNLDILSDPNHSVGIWLEGDDCYLDVSLTVRGKQRHRSGPRTSPTGNLPSGRRHDTIHRA